MEVPSNPKTIQVYRLAAPILQDRPIALSLSGGAFGDVSANKALSLEEAIHARNELSRLIAEVVAEQVEVSVAGATANLVRDRAPIVTSDAG
jgi:hypothetical protein